MASKGSYQGSKVGAVALLLIAVAGLTALAVYVRNTPKLEVRHDPVALQPSKPAEPVKEPAPKAITVTVFTPAMNGEELKLTGESMTPPGGEDPIAFSVNGFLKAAKVTAPEARVRSAEVRNRIAYLDFTDAFAQSYGSIDERTLLRGICASVGQFDTVDKVQFEVGGKPLDSIGNVDLSSPIDVVRDPNAPDPDTPEPTSPKNPPPTGDPSKK